MASQPPRSAFSSQPGSHVDSEKNIAAVCSYCIAYGPYISACSYRDLEFRGLYFVEDRFMSYTLAVALWIF